MKTTSSSGDSDDQLNRVEVYFQDIGNQEKYIPRAVMVDLDPATIDTVRGSKLGSIYRPNNLIMGRYTSSNNWAKGHYTEGKILSTFSLLTATNIAFVVS